MESVGYVTRISSAEHVTVNENGSPHAPLAEVIVSFILLLIPPIILAVVNYEASHQSFALWGGVRFLSTPLCITHNHVVYH